MDHNTFATMIEGIRSDPKNQIIITKIKFQDSCVTVLTANDSVRDKDLKPLQAFIKEQNLMMMVNYNIAHYDKISITLLTKQTYKIYAAN